MLWLWVLTEVQVTFLLSAAGSAVSWNLDPMVVTSSSAPGVTWYLSIGLGVWALWGLMLWGLFAKAGVPRWWALVPFLNLAGACRSACEPWWAFLLILIPFVGWVQAWFHPATRSWPSATQASSGRRRSSWPHFWLSHSSATDLRDLKVPHPGLAPKAAGAR